MPDLEISRNNPDKAIEELQCGKPVRSWAEACRLGACTPLYVRGEAYLQAHRGKEAAAEFQKLIDHRGFVGNIRDGRPRASRSGPRLRAARRYRPRPRRLSRFPRTLERCRRGHPDSGGRQGRIRQAKVAPLCIDLDALSVLTFLRHGCHGCHDRPNHLPLQDY